MLSAQSVLEAMGEELTTQYPDLIWFIDQGLEEEGESDAWFLWMGVAHMDMLIVKLSLTAEFTVSRFCQAVDLPLGHFTGPDAYGESLAAVTKVLKEGYA